MDEEKSKDTKELEQDEIITENETTGNEKSIIEVNDILNEECKNTKNKEIKEVNKKKVIVIIGILGCILAMIFIGINKTVSKYEELVYPGVSIYGEDLSRFDERELQEKLNELIGIINNKKININANNKYYHIKVKDIVSGYNVEQLTKEIMNYKKDKNTVKKFFEIIGKSKKEFKFSIKLNIKEISELEDKIVKETNIKVKEPNVIIDGSNVSYISGKNGFILENNSVINVMDIKLKEINIINKDLNLKLEYRKELPKVGIADIKKVNSKISTYTTTYESGVGRGKNVENAANKIDDLLLMPGEEFSYEKNIGPVTLSNGYISAPVINNGELVQGVGGGVCQVSSTLYNTTLKAGILPTERRNHSKVVNYVPRGLDATLASGSIDYKFKNTYKHPIVINTKYGNGSLTIEIWSKENVMNGIEYKPVSYVRGNQASTYLYGYDKHGKKVYEKHIDTSEYN